ncbi:MAG: dienelactone hydrolase family protein [Nitrososphaerota archaeon]|nr:dienelactone hydrolase family protein [Nitrososphaerota archaeon]
MPGGTGVVSEMTSFKGARGPVTAYLSRPDTEEARPAVVVIHEIWGLVGHIKDVADRFAREGYVALAPDLYSSDPELASLITPQNVGTAMGFMQTLPPEKRADMAFVQQELAKQPAATRDVAQRVMGKLFGGMPKDALTEEAVKAVEHLNSQDYVRDGRVGTMGFCFGGGMSINTACHTKTAACVVFYGENPTPIELVARIQSPVLGLYGGDDMRINSTLDKLVAAMVQHRKDFEMRVFPGAPHAFFNDTNKTTYREGAAKEAWGLTLSFFRRTLQGG